MSILIFTTFTCLFNRINMNRINCPNCTSVDVTYRKKKQCYICEDCNTEFFPEQEFNALRIFISYGHDEHLAFAQKVAGDLKYRGHEVWFDADRLKPGGDWEKYIEEGLRWASERPGLGRIILIMTPHSVRRPDGFCLNEIARALDHHLLIIPVMLVWCSPPLSICRIQWLDMQNCTREKPEEGRYTASITRLFEALENNRLDYEGQASMLRENLNPLSFEADIVHYQKWFTGREWIFSKIDEWLNTASTSRLFWMTGQPGIGKTAVATKLIERLPNLAAFHLCRRGNSEKSSPRRAVMSIAYQLSTQLPDYAEKLSGINLFQLLTNPDVNAPALFDTLIVQPLATDIKRPAAPCVILIDGLDEATSNGRNILAEFIAGEFIKLPEWIRLIITSRPDPEVTQPLQAWERWDIETGDRQNREDIELYIKKMLDDTVPGRFFPEVINTIIENSEGIFLYAEWICREIRDGRIPADSPDSFPKGLGGIYAGFFREKLTREEKYQEDIASYKKEIRPVLELIAGAREPLPMSLLAEWLRWNRYDQETFFRKMGSLFFVDSIDCIRPFHTSVLDWLGDYEKAGEFYVHSADGSIRLTAYLWNEYRENGAARLSGYGLRHLPVHLMETRRWDDLETLLCDLDFIRAKCNAKMTFDLVKDYSLTLDRLPENQGKIRIEKVYSEKLQKYNTDLIAWSKGEIKELEIIPSIEPWSEEKIIKEGQRIIANPSRLDNIRAFAQFLSVESYTLAKFGSQPGFVIQQAYNSSNSGPVNKKAGELIRAEKKTLLLPAKQKHLPSFSPYSALIRTFEGHTGNILKIDLNGEGTRVISAGFDNTLRYWNTGTGECLNILTGHSGSVNCAGISNDGKTAISGSSDRTIRIWDVSNGECRNVLEGHSGEIEDVCLSEDGRMAVSASSDNTVRIWNILTGECCRILEGHSDAVLGVCLGSDGKTAVSAGKDKTIRIWDMDSGKMKMVLYGHTNSVKTVCVTTDNLTVISAGYDKTIRIWDLKNGQCRKVLSGHTGKIEDLSISADGKIAVSASLDRTIRIWNTNTGECIKQFAGHSGWVNAIRMIPDGRRAVSAGEDKMLRLWDLECGFDFRNPDDNRYAIYDVQLSSDGMNAVSAGRDTTLKFWNTVNGECIKVLTGHTGWVTRLCFSPDGRTAISGSNDKTIRVWNLADGKCLKTLTGHNGWISTIIISPDGKRIVSGSVDETVRIWDIHTGECLNILKEHAGNITGLCMTSDSKKVISASHDHTLIIWDAGTGEKLKILTGHTDSVSGVKLLPFDEKVVSIGRDNTLRIWDIRSGQCTTMLSGHKNGIVDFNVTSDGNMAITAGNSDTTLFVWDLRKGTFLKELTGHSDVIYKVMTTPDGRFAISGGKDNTLRIWSLENGRCIGIFTAPGPVYAISSMSERNDFLIGLYSGKVIGIDILNMKRV
jgi:WD40 repeat protein